MHALESYLQDLRGIRASGAAVDETSYYTPLANLLNEIGKTLKPKVRCIMQLKNRGAGLPDGGLFTQDQFQRLKEEQPFKGLLPARGVIEAKPTKDDAWVTADSEQVTRYWGKYRQVLVTNYRDFVLVGYGPDGRSAKLETFRLADSERDFWSLAQHPQRLAERLGDSFVEFLKRVMMHAAVLTSPQEVAWFLASYAREARLRIERGDFPTLITIRSALEEALGMKFEGARGETFFRSTLVQTLFYGMFSAWVLWSKDHPPSDRKVTFDWRMSAHFLKVPILRKLFHEVAEPGQLEMMDLPEVLDWAGAALNRVDRAAFGASFEEGQAVQYFYEPFLEAFDPQLRKDLGVWYTPAEVVEYMVSRVDATLRRHLGIPDGLADPRVYVLDPCCGTGAFLVAVLKRITATLQAKGADALLGHDIKRAALDRVFGFELLPAPFVVAHLQLGLFLQNLGAPLAESKRERASVFLTNALTGWEPPKGPKQRLLFRELEDERDAAEEIKREKPILVILGNPPYNSFPGISKVEEERDLSEAYRTTKRVAPPQGHGLNDLYVRFFRMAERRIVEKTGRGVVCFISNYSWLDGLSHTGMRERYLEVFDEMWIDCLNGDKYRTGKLTPEGDPDPSIFSTDLNREGIQVGTAISLFVRKQAHKEAGAVRFRNLWGKTKRAELLECAKQGSEPVYQDVQPELALGLPLSASQTSASYSSWPLLPELFPVSFPGVKTSRDEALVDIDQEVLLRRMNRYFNVQVDDEEIRREMPILMATGKRFDGKKTRKYLRRRGILPDNVVPYFYRPFDTRWLYWESEKKTSGREAFRLFSSDLGRQHLDCFSTT